MVSKYNLTDISFSTTSFVFARIQVLTWIANGTSLLYLLEKNSCELLADIIDGSDSSKAVVINFKGIKEIDDHALDRVFKVLEDNTKEVIIINGYSLYDKIITSKKDSKTHITTNSADETIIMGRNSAISTKIILEERQQYIDQYIKRVLSETFQLFEGEQRMCSTPIISNGEFNSSLIISIPSRFIWITFFLSDMLFGLLEESKLTNVKLLSASLRGAPFAAMLGLINNLKFETIDHFGPKHKVYDVDFIQLKEQDINYIYVGDFVFGGTEIKIAKTYTELKGSKLANAICIGSLFDPKVFSSEFNLKALLNIKDINPKAIFKLF